jgi:hypothetical protein
MRRFWLPGYFLNTKGIAGRAISVLSSTGGGFHPLKGPPLTVNLSTSRVSAVGHVSHTNGVDAYISQDGIPGQPLLSTATHTLVINCRYAGTISGGLPDGLYGLFNIGYGIGYWWNSGNGFISSYESASGSSTFAFNPNVALFHRYAFVFPGGAQPTIYVDGVPNTAASATNLTANGGSNILRIGHGLDTGSPGFFSATEVESSVYFNWALSADEVSDLCKSEADYYSTVYAPFFKRPFFAPAVVGGAGSSHRVPGGGWGGRVISMRAA